MEMLLSIFLVLAIIGGGLILLYVLGYMAAAIIIAVKARRAFRGIR